MPSGDCLQLLMLCLLTILLDSQLDIAEIATRRLCLFPGEELVVGSRTRFYLQARRKHKSWNKY